MPYCKNCGSQLEEDAKFCPECGTPVTNAKKEPETRKPESQHGSGTRLNADSPYGRIDLEKLPEGHIIDDRYKIIRKLGQGSFGAVYLAYDRHMEIQKALKIIPEAVTNDKEAMLSLRKEATIMVKLNHPNIVRVYDFHHNSEIKYIDMEYVDGTDLSSLKLKQKDKKFPEEEVKQYALQIAEGLAYAHDQRVIHKDIKPQNIMLTKDGTIKLMDFGIAETVHSSMSRLKNTGSSGTLVYMAPEQLRGKDVGRESDIYSLGATLYELLTGNPPFYKGDITYQIISEAPAPLSGFSQQMTSTVMKCLEKEQNMRFRNCEEFIQSLNKTSSANEKEIPPVLNEKEQADKKDDTPDRKTDETSQKDRKPEMPVTKPSKNKKGLAWVIGLLVIALMVLGAFYVRSNQQQIAEQQKIEQQKIERQREEQQRLAQQQAKQKRLAQQRAEQKRIAQQKARQQKIAARQKQTRNKTGSLVWQDNFESYAARSWPASWAPDGNATDRSHNFIDNTQGYQSGQSLRLYGVINGCWGALAYHPLNVSPPFEIRLDVMNGNESLSGCHPDRAGIGLRVGTSWTNHGRGLINFKQDGSIKSGGGNVNLGTYSPMLWYSVKIRYERPSASEVKLSYWIDNQYKGSETIPSAPYENDLNNLSLGVNEGTAWFDNVGVYKVNTVNDTQLPQKTVVAIYGETGGFNVSKHSDKFKVKIKIPSWQGAEFNNDVSEFTDKNVKVIFIGGDNSFSSGTASAIENAVYNGGKILCINFWSGDKFNNCLPAQLRGNSNYGPAVSAGNLNNPIVADILNGVPKYFSRRAADYTRRVVVPKPGAVVITRFTSDNTPAMIVWNYGRGKVIYQPMELTGDFYGSYSDKIMYQALKWALSQK